MNVTIDYGPRECMAYVASQLPFAYAPVQRIFNEIKQRIPAFMPGSMLDFGCGPGTAMWAAKTCWSKDEPSSKAGTKESVEIQQWLGIDISEDMIAIAQNLLRGEDQTPLIDNLEFRRYLSFQHKSAVAEYDLVCANLVLGELPDDHVRSLTVNALWNHTRDMLVLIDRGTPDGFRNILAARNLILTSEQLMDKNGAPLEPDTPARCHIVAPCSHEKKCPMAGSWCHFTQRMQLTPAQLGTHKLPKGFEDQNFTYVVIRRGPRPAPSQASPSLHDSAHAWPRMVRHPLKRGGHVVIDVCTNEGNLQRLVASKAQGKGVYYDARKSSWGDLWPHGSKSRPRVLDKF